MGHAIIVSYVCIDRNIKGDVSLHELYRLFRTRTQYCFIKDSDLKNVSDIAALNSTDMRFIYFKQKKLHIAHNIHWSIYVEFILIIEPSEMCKGLLLNMYIVLWVK